MHHDKFNGTTSTASASCPTQNTQRRAALHPLQHCRAARANPRPQGHTMPSPLTTARPPLRGCQTAGRHSSAALPRTHC
eukprot:5685108-Lingulodinium_polyedra.AAC.1